MINRESALRLPLVHHLVEHCVLHLGPRMPVYVPPTQGDLAGLSGPAVDRELAQPALHSARQSYGYFGEQATEMTVVQLTV